MLHIKARSLRAQFLRTMACTICNGAAVSCVLLPGIAALWGLGTSHSLNSTTFPEGAWWGRVTACRPRQHQQAESACYTSVLHLLHWVCSYITDLWCWTRQQPDRDLFLLMLLFAGMSPQMLPIFTFQMPDFQTYWAAKGEMKSGCLTGLWVPLVYMLRADRKRIKKFVGLDLTFKVQFNML